MRICAALQELPASRLYPTLLLTSRNSATNVLPNRQSVGRGTTISGSLLPNGRPLPNGAKQNEKAARREQGKPHQAAATPLKGPSKVKLTKTAVEAIPPPAAGEIVVWDSELKGFGVRVSASGRRTYFIYSRTTGGKQIKLKVGVHGAVTADKAREIASTEIGKLMAGQDPSRERRQARESERARRIAPTMRGLGDEYLSAHAEIHKRQSSVRTDRATLEKIVFPRFGLKKVSEITHSNIEALHREMRETPYRANRVVALLSKMFNLAIKWGMRSDNPAKGIERYQELKRERYLRPDEIARLGDVLAGHPNRASANAVRMLLLTGARRGEVLSATWDQVDFDDGVWTKPGAQTKQKTKHRIPLSPQALRLLTEIKAEADENADVRRRKAKAAGRIAKQSPFIFPGKDGQKHLTDVKNFWASACAQAEIEGARLHDLRHTYASLLAGDNLSLPIIGALLGHTQPATTARYAHLLDKPLREATTAAAAKLDEYAKAPRKGKLVAVKP